jgi:hypothetical protein
MAATKTLTEVPAMPLVHDTVMERKSKQQAWPGDILAVIKRFVTDVLHYNTTQHRSLISRRRNGLECDLMMVMELFCFHVFYCKSIVIFRAFVSISCKSALY